MTRIMFFGPTGSGKSSVVLALKHQMADPKLFQYLNPQIDLSFSRQITSDEYQPFKKGDETPIIPTSTPEQVFEKFRLERQLKSDSPSDARIRQINHHIHDIDLLDFPGRVFQEIMADKYQQWDDVIDSWVYNPWVNLAQSKGIVVMLDQTKVASEEQSEDSDFTSFYAEEHLDPLDSAISITDQIKPRLWARMIERLTWLKKSDGGSNPFFAICINKIDNLRTVRQREPDDLIELYFGKFMMDAIEKLRNEFGPNHVRTFKLSAVGYLQGDQPNYRDPWVLDESKWKPHRVELPIFWILEQLERESLLYSANDVPVLPRLPFVGKRYVNDLIGQYITYEKEPE